MSKVYVHSWGSEIVVGGGARVLRLYVKNGDPAEVTVDFSQVRDVTWPRFLAIGKRVKGNEADPHLKSVMWQKGLDVLQKLVYRFPSALATAKVEEIVNYWEKYYQEV